MSSLIKIDATSLDATSKRFSRSQFSKLGLHIRLRRFFLYFIVALWLTSISLGLGILLRYSNTPGVIATPPMQWPSESQVTNNDQWATLLIFAHPQCPCTKATLGELELIIARCHGQVRAHVLFIDPEGVRSNWLESDLWMMAKQIPDVTVFADTNGREAQRFHARTSGQTLLYDTNGTLKFNGGITVSRGHSGDNFGRDAIVNLVNATERSCYDPDNYKVFGCALKNIVTNNSREASK